MRFISLTLPSHSMAPQTSEPGHLDPTRGFKPILRRTFLDLFNLIFTFMEHLGSLLLESQMWKMTGFIDLDIFVN